MNTYRVRLLKNGDKMVPYELTISASCPEAAGWKARIEIAEYGWFPSIVSFDDRVNMLKVDSITIDEGGI